MQLEHAMNLYECELESEVNA